MKKHKTRKLKLERETLRLLADPNLPNVAGAESGLCIQNTAMTDSDCSACETCTCC